MMDDETEVIAVFIDEGETLEESGDIDFTATTCLLRDATGSISLKPTTPSDAVRLGFENSGIFRRGTPIVDPRSGEIMGYELEEVERIRVAVG